MTIASGPMPRWRDQSLKRFNHASPNLRLIDAELTRRWGFSFDGCYVVRNIRGGKSPSIHSWGAAIDSRWGHSGRAASLEAIDWLIANSHELHVSSVHDYSGSRIWHRDRQAWKKFGGFGTPNGVYLHYETTIEGWGDETPIADRATGHTLAGVSASRAGLQLPALNDFPPFDPVKGLFSLWPLNPFKPTLQRRVHRTPDVHDATLYLQGVLTRAGRPVDIDGTYGDNTANAVRALQTEHGVDVDGKVGTQTWPAIDALA